MSSSPLPGSIYVFAIHDEQNRYASMLIPFSVRINVVVNNWKYMLLYWKKQTDEMEKNYNIYISKYK